MTFNEMTSIIVLSYNRLEVVDCIKSIIENTDKSVTPYELLVHDNCSTDEVRDEVCQLDCEGYIDKIWMSPQRVSYSEALNHMLTLCDGEWLTIPAFANDLRATPDWLMQAHAEIDHHGTNYGIEKIRNIHWAFYITTEHSPTMLQGTGWGGYVGGTYAHTVNEDPDYTGYGLVHRSLFEKVGYLDTQFNPIYYEDTDYGVRVHKAASGCSNAKEALKYVPAVKLLTQSKLVHRHSETERQGGAFVGVNQARFFAKYPELR
jgi:GT2 family glycosyltransferase